MAARRCSSCAVHWPDDNAFRKCLGCGLTTDRLINARASSNVDLFEVFYRGRGPRDVDIDWDRVLPGLDQIQELERIPTLDMDPTEGAA